MNYKKYYEIFIIFLSILDILNCFEFINFNELSIIILLINGIFLIDTLYNLSQHRKFSNTLILDVILLATILLDFGFIRILRNIKYLKLIKKIYPLINKIINLYNIILYFVENKNNVKLEKELE